MKCTVRPLGLAQSSVVTGNTHDKNDDQNLVMVKGADRIVICTHL